VTHGIVCVEELELVRCGNMFGGTDCEISRGTGPTGMAVTGTSISENGVPKR
jgi:hypothetical protein